MADSIECNSHEASILDNQQLRLNKINESEKYFTSEIQKRELMSKRLSKYIASFDYFDKTLIVLSATSGGISIASFGTAIGIPVGKASASLNLTFSLCAGLLRKLLETTRNKKNKHNKFAILVRSKLNSIEQNF